MADVWKSNPKHYCKFCKCWIADNKPSRDFHEKGKKHQENVQLKIAEIRKKSVQDEKKKDEENSYMREMEEAAKAAFLKDLKADPKLAEQYLEKARAKKRTVGDTLSDKTKSEPSSSKKEETPRYQGTWRLTYSAEGYPYYWNDITAEVSWTQPEGVEIATDSPEVSEQTEGEEINKTSDAKDDDGQTQEEQSDSNSEISEPTDDQHVENKETTLQESKDLIDPSDISSIPLPGEIPLPEKNTPVKEDTSADSELENGTERKSNSTSHAHDSAYGQWEQIQEEQEEEIDLQLPQTESNVKPQVVVVSEPKLKFRQKKHNPLGTGLVEFKKRKLNSHNLKQRSSNT